jgi:nicotinate-nucleotide pyrophosphorylase (carboxylating)
VASVPLSCRISEIGSTDIAAVEGEVARALAEDLGDGDRTAQLIPAERELQTRVICREEAVLCGQQWFDETYRQLDSQVAVEWACRDGDLLKPGQEVCGVNGQARAVLSGERTALNFLQALSGTATRTARYVRAIEGTGATLLDTRKTIPGMRMAQKYAVRCGGGANHRMGLFDAILIKENHIAAAGSISAAVARARDESPTLLLEVEVEDLRQLEEAVEAGAQRVLLDNFPLSLLRQAVEAWSGRIELEASGGISLETVRDVAETGVHFISTGDITKNLHAIDFSMRYI